MNALARFVTEQARLAWALALFVILLSAWGIGEVVREQREAERLTQLTTEAERLGIELMPQTLNGNLMGSVAMLGLIDADIKREALGKLPANNAKVLEILESVGRSYDAEGVFIVAENAIITSSWDNAGKPSTNINVKFRPYYQMAMQGMENIYAAVSIARGDRSLYFAAPIFSETTSGTDAIGAIVARTGLHKIDNLLRDKADHVLLLSPQGVTFASTHKDWIGFLSGKATPERLKAIRDLKQFGNMFAKDDPAVLPFALQRGVQEFDGRRYLVTQAKVHWNDPFGDWQVVLMEDLARTQPPTQRAGVMIGAGLFLLATSLLLLAVLRSHYAQIMSARQIDAFARQQQTMAERKAAIAAAALRLQQAKTLDELCRLYLSDLHGLIGAVQGAVYLLSDGEEMRLAASYACAVPPAPTLRLGDGLLGQCAIEKRVLRLDAPEEEGFWLIRSGLGDSAPRCLLMAPILLNETLLGATEVALMAASDADIEETSNEINKLLALNVEILRRTARTEALLESTVEAERASAERAHFQQVLIDTIPYPVFYKGADTRFLGFNRAYEKTFDMRREDLIGKRVLDLDYLPESDRLAYQAEDEAIIAACGAVEREMQIPFADGKLHDTLYYVSGFRTADGAPGGLVGTFIDIGAQKEAQKNLERLADAERFNRLSQGREARILQLKMEVNALCQHLDKPPRYASAQDSVQETEAADLSLDVHLNRLQKAKGAATEDANPVTVPKLAELVDLNELQVLLKDFCESVGIASAIIDLEGNILATARWQRACTDFHRANPESCARCIESDTGLALQLQEGKDFTLYKCKNGMTDCASPIIVEGHHLANVFIGQFHSAPPDETYFRQQAQKFGYDKEDYLAAVMSAPVFVESRTPSILSFLSGFARMISTMSLARWRADEAQAKLKEQAELLRQERIAALSLAEDAEQTRIAFEYISKESRV